MPTKLGRLDQIRRGWELGSQLQLGMRIEATAGQTGEADNYLAGSVDGQ